MNNAKLLFLNSSAVLNLCGNACIVKRMDTFTYLSPGLVEALKHSGHSVLQIIIIAAGPPL